MLVLTDTYSVFHRFRLAKFAYGSLILSSSQFLLLPQWPLQTTLAMNVVKIDTKNNHLTTLIHIGETYCREKERK